MTLIITKNDVGFNDRPTGFQPRLVPDLPLPEIPTLIIDLVSGPVWCGAAKYNYWINRNANQQISHKDFMLINICLVLLICLEETAFHFIGQVWLPYDQY